MKVLMFITSTRQLEEINLLGICLKKCPTICNMFDLILHNNNSNYNTDIANRYFNNLPIKTKTFIHEKENPGYVAGSIDALHRHYNKLYAYDYVLHIHADVFPIKEDTLLQILKDNLHNDYSLLISRSGIRDIPSCGLQSDFYIFKPSKIDRNFFSGNNALTTLEDTIYKRLIDFNINYLWIPRYKDDYYGGHIPDEIGFWHTHNLDEVANFLKIT